MVFWRNHRWWPRLEAKGWPDEAIQRHLSRRERISNLRLRRLSEIQRGRCAYCTRSCWIRGLDRPDRLEDQATIEHVVPVVHGGSESHFNKVMACRDCNEWRGDSDIEEFLVDLKACHGPFIPGYLRRHLKSATKSRKRQENPNAAEGYVRMVFAVALLMHLDPRARQIVDDNLPNGRLHRRSRIVRHLRRLGYDEATRSRAA